MLRSQHLGIVLGLVIVTALTALRFENPQVLRFVRNAVFDEYQRLSPRPFQPMPVRVVDIDEASLKELGQWPWPRDRVAALVNRLSELGAASIAFDFLFAEPDRLSPKSIASTFPDFDRKIIETLPDNDKVLAQAISGKPVVLGVAISNRAGFLPTVKAGFAYTGENPISAPPHVEATTPLLPELEANAAGIGHVSLSPLAASNVVRALPLLISDGKQLYPNLAIEALRIAQGASTYIIAAAPETPGTITEIKIGEFVVPVTAHGELWLYVRPDRREMYVSAKDILASGDASTAMRSAIDGHIVFVGTSAPGLLDIRTTALGENVPGVSLQAQAVEQILAQTFLSRPDWADGIEILAVSVLGCVVVFLTILVSPAIALMVGMAATAMALATSWVAFRQWGMLFDPLVPVATGIIAHSSMTAYRFLITDRQRRKIRRAFSQYVSPSLLHRVETASGALRLGGDEREVTVMFVDVRNFTVISERLPPTALIHFLNTLLDALSRHVTAHEGTLDKFIGDSIMAFWNAPVSVADHEVKAVRAALAMRQTLARLTAEDAFGFGAGQPVSIGIGIHTGIACVGNMGAENRFNYSAVGDAVNTAARIESACKEVGFDILVSERTASALADYALLDAGALPLKGKSSRTQLYAVMGDASTKKSAEFAELQRLHDRIVETLTRTRNEDKESLNALQTEASRRWPELTGFYRRLLEIPDRFNAVSSTESDIPIQSAEALSGQ